MNMKKILTLVLALMLTFTCAMAQGTEALFEGKWVQFEGGFELYMPSDWVAFEVTEAEQAQGIIYTAGSEDETRLMQLGWFALPQAVTIDQMQAALAQSFVIVEKVNVNGIDLLCAGDADFDSLMFVALSEGDPGYYMFVFTPMSDPTLQGYAAAIAGSLRTIEK